MRRRSQYDSHLEQHVPPTVTVQHVAKQCLVFRELVPPD